MEQSVRIARNAARRLSDKLLSHIEGGRTATFKEVQSVWRLATVRAAEAAKALELPLGAVTAPQISLYGAYESLGAAPTWKTLVPRYVNAAAADVDAIVRASIMKGVSPDKLARALRPYVQGYKEFDVAFGELGVDIHDLRELARQAFEGDPRAVRALRSEAARKLRHNAERISFSETYNARAEAEVQHYAADPLVEAVIWRLADDRGEITGPCECDVLATNDFYGLGAGVYPVTEVPFPPHPWDRCERVPKARKEKDYGTAKPTPTRQRPTDRARLPKGTPPATAKRLRERTELHLQRSAMEGPRGALAEIAESSVTVGA